MPAFDVSNLKTVALDERPSKVFVHDLGRPNHHASMESWLDSLPKQLAAQSLRRLCYHLERVRAENKIAVAAIGGHVIKTGCAPYLIDLMQKGVIKGLALNGAAAIHDLELAIAGRTSEDVGPRLLDGTFGMARETAVLYAEAARRGANDHMGLGHGLGNVLSEQTCPFGEHSILLQAYQLGIPCTVHVAMGCDVVHMHPVMDGSALGAATMTDFRILTTIVSRLSGGLWMNIGCAVLLPEVFLKAVSIARNYGHSLDGMVTANLDMIQQYRGRVNVCERPGDEGILLTGHHEILLPLIHAIVASRINNADDNKNQPATCVAA